jgi:hypothetical protein
MTNTTGHPPPTVPNRAPGHRLAAASRNRREHSRMLREYSRGLRAEAMEVRKLSTAAPERNPAGARNRQ